MKKSDASWQKDNASFASSKDTCPKDAQRNQATRTPLPLHSPHIAPHLLLEYELHVQTMKKQSSLHQNQKKGLMTLSTPLVTSTKEKGKS
jgi:hypothetical protein